MLFRNVRPVAPKSIGTYSSRRRSTLMEPKLRTRARCRTARDGPPRQRAIACSTVRHDTGISSSLRVVDEYQHGPSPVVDSSRLMHVLVTRLEHDDTIVR